MLTVLVAIFAINPLHVRAATGAETKLFNDASMSFNDKNFERAEREFGEFVTVYTNSPLLPDALLHQAVARLRLKDYDGAAQLLNSHLTSAGKLVDQYYFWLGKIYMAEGKPAKYQQAIDWFAKVQKDYPASTNALEAAVEQAAALTKLGQSKQVIELLQQTNRLFQSAVRTNQPNELLTRAPRNLSPRRGRRACAHSLLLRSPPSASR